MVNIGAANGPFLVAVMISFMLFGVTCSQTVYYFRTYPGDHRFLKALVIVLLILEGVHTAFVVQAVFYAYLVCKLPENISIALDVPLGSAGSITATIAITSIVQSFYAWRVYRLSVGHQLQKPLVAFILVTSLAQLGAGLALNSAQYIFPSVKDSRRLLPKISFLADSAMSVTCDVTISASLVYFLNRMRTGFKSSENVINYLVIFSMSNGVLTSTIVTCSLVSFYTAPTSLLYSAFIVISGKFYFNSMLVTYVNFMSLYFQGFEIPISTFSHSLNSRTKVRGMLGDTHTQIIATEGYFTAALPSMNTNAQTLSL
ncbi:hypothetical protein E4T56_gene1489 [Termitomyces sp. T112]|nr:hypothetical protein E4T56_gene1489 [Termitomyces sp. T112]